MDNKKKQGQLERRQFLRAGGALAVGTACAYGLPLLAAAGKSYAVSGQGSSGKVRWGMVVDLTQCREGCTACVDACRKENNVASHGNKKWDVHRIRKVKIRRTYPAQSPEKPMLLLCNHCDHPPCEQACPVKATHKRDDGIVIVDHHRCIGCRYCMIACPYNARHFNYKEKHEWSNPENTKSSHGVPESCNFCAHRLRDGKRPACVEACGKAGANALAFGNLNDPSSEVSQLCAGRQVKGIREDLGTRPKVFYIGL